VIIPVVTAQATLVVIRVDIVQATAQDTQAATVAVTLVVIPADQAIVQVIQAVLRNNILNSNSRRFSCNIS